LHVKKHVRVVLLITHNEATASVSCIKQTFKAVFHICGSAICDDELENASTLLKNSQEKFLYN